MVTIKLRSLTGEGSFGSYYKLNPKQGVKVLNDGQFTNMRLARKSKEWRRAEREAKKLVKAQSSGVVPKCYGVILVKFDNFYKIGIVMEHLGTTTLSNHFDRIMSDETVLQIIHKKLCAVGILHLDLNDDNIMFYKNKYYAIDFGVAKYIRK